MTKITLPNIETKKMYMFESRDETIIGMDRNKIIKEYFEDANDRDIDDYDETEIGESGSIRISSQLAIRAYSK